MPPDSHAIYSEKSISLPHYWCYSPSAATPDVNPLPALSRGHITFASLNNFAKVSPAAINLWAQILAAIPQSELILHACPGSHRHRLLAATTAAGVHPDRIRFFDRLELQQYLTLHHAIDIALDAFPYSGATTICDALWMGVPTISLYAAPAFTRGGLSILSAIDLPELAVNSEPAYLSKAIALAQDPTRLAHLRATMRDRLRASPLMDPRTFARNVEQAFRQMWRTWCES